MKKTVLTLAVLVSLSGVSYIFYRLYSVSHTVTLRPIPEMPANLDAPVATREVSVSPPVPILMYHHVQNVFGGIRASDAGMFVSPKNFEAQLKWLSENGFVTVGPDYFGGPMKPSGKPIILTFDDGYQDSYDNVFPILKKYGFQGTFYPIVDNIDRSGFLTTEEIREMEKGGMRFGSHTYSHPNLAEIPTLQAEQEIYGSKKTLEEIAQTDIADFCYPVGAFDRRAENILSNSGYRTAVTVRNELNDGPTDPLLLNRLNIGNDTVFAELPSLSGL